MALQKSFKGKDGVVHPEAYHIIGDMKSRDRNKPSVAMMIPVEIYHNKDFYDAGEGMIDGKPISFAVQGSYYQEYFAQSVLNLVGVNPITQGYAYLTEDITIPEEPADDDPDYDTKKQAYLTAVDRAITVNGIQNYYVDAVVVAE